MLCPACTKRQDQLVTPGCPVCHGAGVLDLGEPALSFNAPNIVARAVRWGLEAVARHTDTSLTLSDDRTTPISRAVRTLQADGLLAPPHPDMVPRHKTRPLPPGETPQALAGDVLQETITGLDIALADAACYQYAERERPNARGLPLLSANGHPSHLARVTDPQEPGRDTREHVRQHARDNRRTDALLRASVTRRRGPRAGQATNPPLSTHLTQKPQPTYEQGQLWAETLTGSTT